MKLTYYADTDTLSIALQPGVTGAEAREIADDDVVDFDSSGRVIAIDIDLASTKMDLSVLDAVGLRNVHVYAEAPGRADASEPIVAAPHS
jgi:uncharacterized protein YuzE